MMANFKKPNITKKSNNLKKNYLPLFANVIKADIIERTQSGKDVNNRVFKPYTERYAKSKIEKYGSSKVNLTRTQQMFNAIDWKNIKNGIRFFFNSKEQNSKAHGNQYRFGRYFFGMDKQSKINLIRDLRDIYSKALKS